MSCKYFFPTLELSIRSLFLSQRLIARLTQNLMTMSITKIEICKVSNNFIFKKVEKKRKIIIRNLPMGHGFPMVFYFIVKKTVFRIFRKKVKIMILVNFFTSNSEITSKIRWVVWFGLTKHVFWKIFTKLKGCTISRGFLV